MSIRFLIILILFLSGFTAKSQGVLWATEVLEVSSAYTDASYSPRNRSVQILGTPSVYPQMVKSACAWQPNGSDFGEDYIKVKFEKAIHIRQIALIENVNPGAVARIFGYDESGKEYLLFQNAGTKTNTSYRFWRVFVEPTANKLNAVKLVINHRMAKGIKQYDAIAISESEAFIDFKINLAEDELKDTKKENLGSILNSSYSELAPIITPDGKTLFFTRKDHPDNIIDKKNKEASIKQDIWFSNLVNNEWSLPENLGEPVNDALDNAAATASADGSNLYVINVYEPDGTYVSGLSKTSLRNGKWHKPKKVGIDNFQAKAELGHSTPTTEFSISNDEKVLIMGLKRTQTLGAKDLYVSFLQKNGTFSSPINLGNVINTAESEGSPFLSADNKTLYFNSTGHPGYGGADIYMSKRLDETWTKWSVPVNLGSKINSKDWDGFFSIPASGEYSYFSSSDNAIGGNDIFKIKLSQSLKPDPLVVLTGKVVEVGENIGLDIPFEIVSDSDSLNDLAFNIELHPDTKSYKVVLPAGFKYHFNINTEGYMLFSDSLDFSKEKNYREVNKDFRLIPIRAGNKMVLENLIFDQGRYRVKKSSYDELDQLVGILNKYPNMHILLEGHTDNQGDFTLNVELAKKRVEATKKHLVEKGNISSDRIQTKSWGPLKPISSNSTPETRKKNRRVEFTILKM